MKIRESIAEQIRNMDELGFLIVSIITVGFTIIFGFALLAIILDKVL